jgi:hypothetical protein
VIPVIIKGKKFGEYEIKNKILFYHTHRNKIHFMRKFLGFGISWSVLCYLQAIVEKHKCEKAYVIFHYHGKRGYKRYVASLFQFFKSEKTYTDDTMFYGDYQKFLSLEEMMEK